MLAITTVLAAFDGSEKSQCYNNLLINLAIHNKFSVLSQVLVAHESIAGFHSKVHCLYWFCHTSSKPHKDPDWINFY